MQSRKGSLMESLTNIMIGVSIGIVSNLTVLPAFGYPVEFLDSIGIAIVFTKISLVRSYVIRRLFNKYNFFEKRIK